MSAAVQHFCSIEIARRGGGEKVTSISKIRNGGDMLEESIRHALLKSDRRRLADHDGAKVPSETLVCYLRREDLILETLMAAAKVV